MAAPRRRPSSTRQYVAQPVPDFVEFQHPMLVSEPPTGAHWIHETKWDGYRLQMRVEGRRVTIWTRNGHDWTAKFPEIAGDLAQLPDCILDGELVNLNGEGYSSFSGLRASISPGKTADLVVYVFDILWHGQDDLRRFPLLDRKQRLAKLLASSPSDRLRVVEPLAVAGGPILLQAACRLTWEGIVSKRRDQPYRAGKGDTWVKSKCRPGQEVVIGGFEQETGRAFKALLLGVYEGDRLRYVGSTDKGFKAQPDLLRRLAPLAADKSPFLIDSPRKSSAIHWLKPELVANVEFAEWTASGKLRQASFKGLREDKDPLTVRRERPEAEPL